MLFRTEYKAVPGRPIDVRRPVVMLGSCFADNIGERLHRCMAPATVNPCGTLFNPTSIASAMLLALGDRQPEIVPEPDGRWFSWDFSTLFTAPSAEEMTAQADDALSRLGSVLRECAALIVTFGTAIVYELADRPGRVVANCHKHPAAEFSRRMLTIAEIVDTWLVLSERLAADNPDTRIILTVSPVRHIKEGMRRNTLSKASLHLACEELCRRDPSFEYFPAFEIVNDDLRDYRFCAPDMQHPSETAVEYVWQKFCETYISPDDMEWMTEGARLTSRLNHRHLNPDSDAARRFDAQTRQMLRQFNEKYPWTRTTQ